MKFNKLFEQDFKIVENKKKVFIAPVVCVVLALIAGIVFHFVSGSAFNLGMDFTGGYTISVNLGNKLTDDTYDYYKDYAVNVAEELKDSSVVIASYDMGDNTKGLIGVVGPTRMDYSAVAAKLSFLAAGLSKRLGAGSAPPSGMHNKLIIKGDDIIDEQ